MDDESPIMTTTTSDQNIRNLILEKEKELHDINEYRIRTLESLLKEKVGQQLTVIHQSTPTFEKGKCHERMEK